MSDTTTPTDRDTKTGRFLPGNSGHGGRPRGARTKLGEAFLEDLKEIWNERGIDALRRCADESPDQFCRIVANLLPRTVDLNMTVNASGFVDSFRNALAQLGNDPDAATPRVSRKKPFVIEHQ